MTGLRRLLFRLHPLWRRGRINRSIAAELESHLQMAIDEKRAQGLSPDEARRTALAEFGNVERIAEEYRDERGVTWVSDLQQDVLAGLRSLLRTRLATITMILALSLGIGTAAGVFSLVDTALHRLSRYPADLVLLGFVNKQGTLNTARNEIETRAYRELHELFSATALAKPFTRNVASDGEVLSQRFVGVTGGFFTLFGIRPQLGRDFLPEEDSPGKTSAVVISHGFWQRHFGGSSEVLGRTLVLDEMPCTIVGVLPPEAHLPPLVQGDAFRPLGLSNALPPSMDWYHMFAKLRPGVSGASVAQALDTMDRDQIQLPEMVKTYRPVLRSTVMTMPEAHQVARGAAYWVLITAVASLYGIACLNAANLMLLRTLARRREFSIRLALGAGRLRLVRLIAVESLLVTLLASVLGAWIANLLVPMLSSTLGAPAFEMGLWVLDTRALVLLVGLTLLSTLFIVGVVYQRLRSADALSGLKEGAVAMGETRQTSTVRNTLTVLQVALSVLLLTGATLMARTLGELAQVDVGFDETQVMKVELAIPGSFMAGTERRIAFLEALRVHLLQVPGVSEVAFGTNSFLRGQSNPSVVVAAGNGTTARGEIGFVSTTFLDATGIRLLRGRKHGATGAEVLVNESLARALFGEQDPVDEQLRVMEGGEGKHPWRIVGVVRDVPDSVRSRPGNLLYAPESWYVPGLNHLVIRTTRDADAAMVAAVRKAIYAYAPRLVVLSAAPAVQVRGWQSSTEEMIGSTLRLLSLIALTLTVIGLFSVLGHLVDQRRSEFGIRMALGATPGAILNLVLRRAFHLVGLGAVLGLAAALFAARYLHSLLYGVAATDPFSISLTLLILLLAGALAAFAPAWRASRVNPSKLLQVN